MKNVWNAFVTFLLHLWTLGKIGTLMFWDDVKSLWFKFVYYVVGALVYYPVKFLGSKFSTWVTRLSLYLLSVRMKW